MEAVAVAALAGIERQQLFPDSMEFEVVAAAVVAAAAAVETVTQRDAYEQALNLELQMMDDAGYC